MQKIPPPPGGGRFDLGFEKSKLFLEITMEEMYKDIKGCGALNNSVRKRKFTQGNMLPLLNSLFLTQFSDTDRIKLLSIQH